ncbi:fibrocystin-L-like [Mercenaria mercenaria]|uniref:fibrocystin-L-like n=1 Tax=Mercenaria mercenaria TaxID=6596 RepID=UPI00234EEC65|nr:fibrocystin-L-like [Mercenaria mercenaria]
MRAEMLEGKLQYDLIPGSVLTVFQTARQDDAENIPPAEIEQSCSMNVLSQQTQQYGSSQRILPLVPCLKDVVSDHKGVLEEEDLSVLVDLSSHKSSVDGIKDTTNTVGRKNVKHGRVLGDISNTVCLKLKFDEVFKVVLPTEDDRNAFEQELLTDYANSWPDVQLNEGNVYEGSIVVEFVIAGSVADLNSTVYEICDDIYNGTQYIYNNFTLTMSSYMQLNNTAFYGVKCGDIVSHLTLHSPRQDDGQELSVEDVLNDEEPSWDLKFDEVFKVVLPTEDDRNAFEQELLTDYANSWPDVQLNEGNVYEGSIVVEFVIAGSVADVNSAVYEICDDIYNGTQYIYNNFTLTMSSYMQLNNTAFYGVKCGDIPDDKKNEDTAMTVLLLILIASAFSFILLIVVIVVVIWRCKITPKLKVHALHSPRQDDGQELSVEDVLNDEEPSWDVRKGPKTQTEAAFGMGTTVTSVRPTYGSIGGGTLITITGSGFSKNQFSLSDDPNVGNRVYLVSNAGSQYSCPVIKESSSESVIVCYTTGYGFGLDHDDSDYGFIKCKTKGTSVEITGLSHTKGSTAGGLSLTIYGKYFDDTAPYTKPNAYVGDTVCEITNVVRDVSVECIVDADPLDYGPKFAGGRGVNFELWTPIPNAYKGLDSIIALKDSYPGYRFEILDETYFSNNSFEALVSRMTTFFTPPHTGEYQFSLFAWEQAKLFVDGISKINSSHSWKDSDRMTLDKDKKYLLEILHYANSNPVIHLKVKYFGTLLTNALIEKAKQEEQIIEIESEISNEVQRLEFKHFTGGRSYVSETQTVDIETSGEFRFGLYGVYTGDFPDIDVVKVKYGFPVSYNVTEDTRGIPDIDTVVLELDGVVSEPFSVASLTAGEIDLKDNVLGTLDAKCPHSFETSDMITYYESFETDSAWFSRYRVRSPDAFCGKHVLKNPMYVYKRKEDEDIFLTYDGMDDEMANVSKISKEYLFEDGEQTAVVVVKRLTEASPPISGSVDLTFNGNEKYGAFALETTVSIYGTGFSAIVRANNVTVGGIECDVTAAEYSKITCDIGNSPAGTFPVLVKVEDKGYASGKVYFTYTADMLSIFPTSGGIGGGVRLTIDGFGFRADVNVSINKQGCDIISAQTTEIQCIVPYSGMNGTFELEMYQESSVLTHFGYTYAFDLTAMVDSVSPQTIGIGGDSLIITGFSFTSNPGTVSIGNEEVTIISWSDTEIEISVSNIDPGVHELMIETAAGFAVNSTNLLLPTVNVEMSITSVNPCQGSVFGGTQLTIKGQGFGINVDVVKVKVGNIACPIDTLSDTQATCTVGDTGSVHLVTNKGVDRAFGDYYAYDKPYIVIKEGDYVQWSWETPEFVIGIAHSIIEVDSPNSFEQSLGGFNSGKPSRNGGPLDGANETLCVSDSRITDDDDETQTLEETSYNFQFKFCQYETPVVNMLSTNNGTIQTNIIIAGEGFAATNEKNEVYFDIFECKITTSKDNFIICNLLRTLEPPSGVLHQLKVNVYNRGLARINIRDAVDRGFALLPNIEEIKPLNGSLAGGTKLTIKGFGFGQFPLVMVGGYVCDVIESSFTNILCYSPPSNTEDSKAVEVFTFVNNSPLQAECELESTSSCLFSYKDILTPRVYAINPTTMSEVTEFYINGTLLGNITSDVEVTFSGISADVIEAGNTYLLVVINSIQVGPNEIVVRINGLGKAVGSLIVNGLLSISKVQPLSGSIYGGTVLNIEGNGFTVNYTTVLVGFVPCDIESIIPSNVICVTRPNNAGTLNVVMNSAGFSASYGTYSYANDSTPAVVAVEPKSGYPGDILTIYGSHLSGTYVTVFIGQSICDFISGEDVQLSCTVGMHPTGQAPVLVKVTNLGISNTDVFFEYGLSILSIAPSQGKLIFDEKDLELQSNIILITDGGVLQIGTEDQPFKNKAKVTLHGHLRSKELPIYGTKVLAVRNGTLDMHGCPVPITWTRLSTTASEGDNMLHLVDPVDWHTGDEIAISSSGHHKSQTENEKKIITEISEDKRTVTLDSPLRAKHIGAEENFNTTLVQIRAEVGLLTHNIVVRGNNNSQWTGEANKCMPGEHIDVFQTQTCFHGRVEDVTGSSQFGATIIVHTEYNSLLARVRISYTEITFAGQANRQGRHPVFFHLNGKMSTSYLRGCSVHETFNRAINIQGSNNLVVEKTVIYNVLGGGIFLEDGTETGNILQYNLAILVRGSACFFQDDITPASFWITNPDNILQHNAAAGGTHYGYTYRIKPYSTGPSSTNSVNPSQVPLTVFRNNSAHSFGKYGLWIFKDYFPRNAGVVPARVENFFAWNNEIGIQVVNSWPMHFINIALVQNKVAGYESRMFYDVPGYEEDSPILKHSLIAGTTRVLPSAVQGCTRAGSILPHGRGFRISNVTFINFVNSSCAALRWAKLRECSWMCGGYTYYTDDLKFIDAPNKVSFEWEWEAVIFDMDGTATGKSANWTILPASGSLPYDCELSPDFSAGIHASMCPPQHKWHRFSFSSSARLRGNNFIIANEYGNSSVRYAKYRLTHDYGWTCALLDGSTYEIHFEPEERRNNLSFSGMLYDFKFAEYIIYNIKVNDLPDKFSVNNIETNMTVDTINITVAETGDWMWNNMDKEITFPVKASRTNLERSYDIPFSLHVLKCLFKDCIPPPDPNTVAPDNSRPFSFQYWHDRTIWNLTSDGYITNVGEIGTEIPQDYDDVRILFNTWVVVNKTEVNKLGTLLLEGVLEFSDIPGAVFNIEADFIIIKGGRLIMGWLHDPFDALARITLRGNKSSLRFDLGDGHEIGPKSIGVFGGLDLIGQDVGITWTELAATVHKGSRQIKLKDPVQWATGNEIVIGHTSFDPHQIETLRIVSVDQDNVTLTLNDSLRYKHIVHAEILSDGRNVSLGASVGLLTRNIKIMAKDDKTTYEESFGARVYVGNIVHTGRPYTGYARLKNVEFYHTGQSDGINYERFSLSFVNVGKVNYVKPSIVTKCSFRNGFHTAVGALGIENLDVSSNIIVNHFGHGIMTDSFEIRIVNNLIIAPKQNGIEAAGPTHLFLQNNMVMGSGKIGYHIPAEKIYERKYFDNKMYCNVIGGLFSGDTTDARISGFTSWKNLDIGLYYIGRANVVIEQNILIENQIGLGVVLSQDQVDKDRFVHLKNTTFIGQTTSFDCLNDKVSPGMRNHISTTIFSPRLFSSHGMFGLAFPHFSSIGGITRMTDVTFSKYSTTLCKNNYVLTTNIPRYHVQGPIDSEDVTLNDVDHSNKVIVQRADDDITDYCINVNCDSFKYVVLRDLDGSFLGHIGTVVPESEYGRIDECRVPKEMVTMINGTRIPFEQIAPKTGVVRNDNCIYRETWQAYQCFSDLNYIFMKIKNMDRDARYRQISPIAILSDGYLDMIDVPQDHIRCKVYTCKQRKSSFITMVATGYNYLMHFTGTTPRHLRYRFVNANSDEGIKLTVWYSRPNRLDVFVDDQFEIATNARIDDIGRYIISMPKSNEYEPQITDVAGTNFYDRNRGEITLIVKGSAKIDVKTQETIIVSFGFPALTVEEFYGDKIIEILAAFLDIPLTKIRIVNIVSEQTRRRKKRADSQMIMEVEIGDEPVEEINSTLSDTLESSELVSLASKIVNECQFGNMTDVLNVITDCETIEIQTDDTDTGFMIYDIVRPKYLFLYEEPEADFEGGILQKQPKIRAADVNSNPVYQLGTLENPWEITVTLRDEGTGENSAYLSGNLSVNSSDGWFNFSDLAISAVGSNYILDFNVNYPSNAEKFSVSSKPFDVPGRPIKANVQSKTTAEIYTGDALDLTLELQDERDCQIIKNITWRQHTWSAEVGMLGSSPHRNVTGTCNTSFDAMTGEAIFSNLSFTGFGVYYLQFSIVSNPPEYSLTLNHRVIIKSPALYNSTIEEVYEVKIKLDENFEDVLPTIDKQNEFEQEILTEYANKWTNVQLLNGSVNEGSIVVTFVFAGSKSAMNSTLYGICSEISNGTHCNFDNETLEFAPYMTVNDSLFYGVKCGEISKDDSDNDVDESLTSRDVVLITMASFAVVFLVAVLVAISIWRHHFKPKTRTNVADWALSPQYSDNGQEMSAEDVIDEKEELERIECRSPQTPAATAFDTKKPRHTFSHFFLRINSPEPLHPPGYTTGNEL